MALYRLLSEEHLEAPVMVAALEGWVDALNCASAAAGFLARDGEPYAVFDSDALYDYRSRRPVLDVVDGTMQDLDWPELAVTRVRVEGRDLLVLTGPEPDMRWKELGGAIVDLALRAGVVEGVSLGAIAAMVPHTRPTPLLSTASDRELLRTEDRPPEGLLRVPGAAVNLVELNLAEHGIPCLGFWAQVPHYVNVTFSQGVMALVQRLGRYLGVSFETDELRRRADEQRTELDEIVSQRPDAQEYLERLESAYVGEEIPSGEEIAAEVERFLRRQSDNPFEDDA